MQPALPAKRLIDDHSEIVVAGLPSQPFADPVDLRDQGGRIAGPSARVADLEIDAGHSLHDLDDLEHREPAPIAAIQQEALAAVPQMDEGKRRSASAYLESFFRDIATDEDVTKRLLKTCIN